MKFELSVASGRPARRRAVAAVAVLVVHGLLVFVGWQTQLVLPRVSETPNVTWMRLVPERVLRSVRPDTEVRTERLPSAPRAMGAPARARPSPETSSQNVPAEPAPIVLITEPRTSPPPAANSGARALPGHVGLDGAEVASPAPAARAASGAGGLVLTPSREVLRESFANPGVLDPRSNTPVPTFEERIAMGMDPQLCIKLERLPDGTIRRSMGRLVEVPSAMQAAHGVKTAPVRVCP